MIGYIQSWIIHKLTKRKFIRYLQENKSAILEHLNTDPETISKDIDNINSIVSLVCTYYKYSLLIDYITDGLLVINTGKKIKANYSYNLIKEYKKILLKNILVLSKVSYDLLSSEIKEKDILIYITATCHQHKRVLSK